MKPASRQEPPDDAIIVWLTRVGASQAALVSLAVYLDARDAERANRFRFAEDRARFTLGRALARECLGRLLRREPTSIEFAYTDRRRPILAGQDEIQFSISHAGDFVAVAVTRGAQVGIDLESLRYETDVEELAPRIFSAEDQRRFAALPADQKRAAFFRAWTRKESYLKARGEGIAEALEQISVSFDTGEVISIDDLRDATGPRGWRLHDLPTLPVDYSGSVACSEAAREIDLRLVRFQSGEVLVQAPPG